MKKTVLFTLCLAVLLSLTGCAAGTESSSQTATVTLAPAYEDYERAVENYDSPVKCVHSNDYTEPALLEGDYYPNGDKNAKYHIHISGGSSGTVTYEGDLYEIIIQKYDYYEPILNNDAPKREESDSDIEKFMSIEGYNEVEKLLKSPCPYTILTRHNYDDLPYIFIDYPDYFSDECLQVAGHSRVFCEFFYADENNFGYPDCQYIRG